MLSAAQERRLVGELLERAEAAQDATSTPLLRFSEAIPLSGSRLHKHHAKLILRAFKENSELATKPSSPRPSLRSPRAAGAVSGGAGPGAAPGPTAPLLSPRAGKPEVELSTVLNALLPPRREAQQERSGEEETESWVKFVSPVQATRDEVVALGCALEAQLADRQARRSGLCPVKEELLSEAFDELLRQVTIDCPERGLLLLRVRDELRMSLATYRTVFESSSALGGRTAAQSSGAVRELEAEAVALEREIEALHVDRQEWRNSVARGKAAAQREHDRRRAEAAAQIEVLETQIKSFKEFLDKA
jgi:dynein light intermediate chain